MESEAEVATCELVIDPAEVGVHDHEAAKRGEESGNGRNGSVLTAYNVLGDPEVLVIPNFVNEAEVEHLLELAKDGWAPSEVGSGVYRSKNEGKDLENQVSDIRTSYSCLIEPNYTPMVAAIENRLAALADMDVKFLEPLNMVRYAPGQFFKEHHDGRFRPITVFVYLNDIPPGEGGETYFRELNMKVVPRRGCAVMWTNIVGPQQEDHRMVHQGLPPAFATKYGVNCFFNDKPMRRFVFEGEPESSRPTCQTNITTLDPLEIASRYPAKVKHTGPGLCFQRLRISQEPAIWMVPNVVNSKEAGQLMDLMDKQQGRVPSNGWRTSATAEDLQQLLMDLEARLATAAGCGDQSPLGALELRRLPPEATQGAAVVSQQQQAGDCRAVYLFLHDIADDCAGEVFFPNANLQVKAREGCALAWDLAGEHQGLPPRNCARYGVSCTFLVK